MKKSFEEVIESVKTVCDDCAATGDFEALFVFADMLRDLAHPVDDRAIAISNRLDGNIARAARYESLSEALFDDIAEGYIV